MAGRIQYNKNADVVQFYYYLFNNSLYIFSVA